MMITTEDITLAGFIWLAAGSIAAFWAALTVYRYKIVKKEQKFGKKKKR